METQTKPILFSTSKVDVMLDITEKYLLVGWPEIQEFMEHPRWSECYLLVSRPDQEYLDSTYAVPESLYNEIYDKL